MNEACDLLNSLTDRQRCHTAWQTAGISNVDLAGDESVTRWSFFMRPALIRAFAIICGHMLACRTV